MKVYRDYTRYSICCDNPNCSNVIIKTRSEIARRKNNYCSLECYWNHKNRLETDWVFFSFVESVGLWAGDTCNIVSYEYSKLHALLDIPALSPLQT